MNIEFFMIVWNTKGPSSIVNTIDGAGGKDVSYDAPSTEVVTGSRDGSVKVMPFNIM